MVTWKDERMKCSWCKLWVPTPCATSETAYQCLKEQFVTDHKPATYPDASFYVDASKKAEDIIKEPRHYACWTIEPKTFIMENELDFATGNVIKYLMRHQDKNGKEDLEKAKEYIDWLIKAHYPED